MKFSMFVTSDAMQVNLEPENEHERKFVAMLNEAKGEVTLHHGAEIARCQGGWMRDFGERQTVLAIQIKTASKDQP